MIKLYGFGPKLGLIDLSPFVLKIDAYLRMAGIEFESVTGYKNLSKAPKGKLPFITDGNITIADTFFILDYLQKKYNYPLDNHLSDEHLALSGLLMKSLDENFYWCIVHSRWTSDGLWPMVKKELFSDLPFPLKHVAPIIARRGYKGALVEHGMGRHSDEEIIKIANKTLTDLSVVLSDKTYFFGNSPCTFDAVAYAFIAQVTQSTLDNPLNQLSRTFNNLTRFCEHINIKYYA